MQEIFAEPLLDCGGWGGYRGIWTGGEWGVGKVPSGGGALHFLLECSQIM